MIAAKIVIRDCQRNHRPIEGKRVFESESEGAAIQYPER
jgi:hypothetical protein